MKQHALPLVVLGTGLVSPLGITPRDHAFLIRGRLNPTIPSPYVDAQGDAVAAWYCRWLGAALSVSERMDRLAFTALASAAQASLDRFEAGWDVVIVVEAERPGLTDEAIIRVRSAAKTLFAGKQARYSVERSGAAGCQQALVHLAERLSSGESQVGCVLGVDSFICREAIAVDRRPPVIWESRQVELSEAAAALLVTTEQRVPKGQKPIGRLLYNAALHGSPCDLNDEIVDGVALTYLLSHLPDVGGALPAVFGPRASDPLRLRDWALASARKPRLFCSPWAMHDLETAIGRIGAASGVAHLVHGLTCLRHGTADPSLTKHVTALGWAISRDGLRGVTLFQGGTP